jgi:hypothetical protein
MLTDENIKPGRSEAIWKVWQFAWRKATAPQQALDGE